MKTFLLSTRNAHKVAEIRALLGDAFEYLTLADFPEAPTVKEDADTFAGNAAKKAVELAAWVSRQGISTLKSQISDLWVLADDSGLEVDAIGGAPGVHSARFAALDQGAPGNSPDAANNAKLLRLLDGVPWEKRTARFRCVIAIVAVRTLAIATTDRSSVDVQGFQGTCEGRIGLAPRGDAGFGYDPLFVPDGFAQTFAELGEDTKNQISHRAKALLKLRQWLKT
ncbi:MAG: non-canonical purine NTP pyrophosphatase [Verrucomicrobia bacterium]|nr:non-canonical purine NTP pyrophosphatase [Verrucomicrobiota bacterium]